MVAREARDKEERNRKHAARNGSGKEEEEEWFNHYKNDLERHTHTLMISLSLLAHFRRFLSLLISDDFSPCSFPTISLLSDDFTSLETGSHDDTHDDTWR